MASWMVHLRIADELLTRIKGLNEETFILGNIAPDSGVPNKDWSSFTPPGNVTHYRDNDKDKTHINIDKYVSEYLTKEKIESYTVREFSFYLGYYTHLLTDIEWAKMVHSEGVDEEHARCVNMTLNEFIWKNKEESVCMFKVIAKRIIHDNSDQFQCDDDLYNHHMDFI